MFSESLLGTLLFHLGGPSYKDQWAASALAHASGRRTKDRSPVRPNPLLPVGMELMTHVALGRVVKTPLEARLALPPDLGFTYPMACQPDYPSWALAQQHILRKYIVRETGLFVSQTFIRGVPPRGLSHCSS